MGTGEPSTDKSADARTDAGGRAGGLGGVGDALSVTDLAVGYRGGVTALDGISLTVRKGTVLAVLGANGAGKSTLLRAISGVIGHAGGTILGGRIAFNGTDITNSDSAEIVRSGIVQVPEGRRIFGDLTVEENLRIGAHTVPASERDARIAEVEELFPILAERRDGLAGLLSGGQQQMLAIGRAMMARPQLLLLDEPSLGLAPKLVEQIGRLITQINATGTSVLLIEQNATMGLSVADDAVVLEVGRVRTHGPAAELAATDEIREWYLGVAADPDQPNRPPDGVGPADTLDHETPGARRNDGPIDGPTGGPIGGPVGGPVGGEGVEPLVATGITKRFGGVVAVDDVDLTVAPGEIHALIGPNGAGKSTFINVVSGVIRPSHGSVLLGTTDLTKTPLHRFGDLGISRTFQNLSLSPDATVLDSIMVGRNHLMKSGIVSDALRLPWARREERTHRGVAEEVAYEVGVGHLLDAPISELAYGDRKRVELGRAICGEPKALLLDEPVAGMTHGESQQMADAIRTAHRRHGFSVLLVEHDMAFVMQLADTVTVLDFGARIANGTPAAVQNDPAVQEAYLGAPS